MTTINSIPNALISATDPTGVLNIQTNSTTALSIASNSQVAIANTMYVANSTTFATNVSMPNTFGFKNRIINGAMVIDQRNSGASVNNSAGAYVFSVDRFKFWGTNANIFKVQQNAGSVTPPPGFTNYIGVTSLAATTPSSTDQYFFGQIIEGYNIADIGMGTSYAKQISISFWAYSSLTGTFGGALQTSAGTCPFSYTIISANTWTYCTIVTNPNTSYSPNSTTNGTGMWALFDLGSGSTFYGGTANTWGSTAVNSVSGTNKLISTNGATLYLTGFQLEVGTQATSFDYRPYGTELALCQRYYYAIFNPSSAQGYSSNPVQAGSSSTSGNFGMAIKPPVSMRSTSFSVNWSNPSNNIGWNWTGSGSGYFTSSAPTTYSGSNAECFAMYAVGNATGSSGTFSQGSLMWLYCWSTGAVFGISTEL